MALFLEEQPSRLLRLLLPLPALQEQSRQHQESAKREQEDKLTAQREAAALRGRLQQAEAAVTQQRSLAAPIETALKMMAAAVQQLKGDAGGS